MYTIIFFQRSLDTYNRHNLRFIKIDKITEPNNGRILFFFFTSHRKTHPYTKTHQREKKIHRKKIIWTTIKVRPSGDLSPLARRKTAISAGFPRFFFSLFHFFFLRRSAQWKSSTRTRRIHTFESRAYPLNKPTFISDSGSGGWRGRHTRGPVVNQSASQPQPSQSLILY